MAELDDAFPVLIEMIECTGKESVQWSRDVPTCRDCYQEVPYEVREVDADVCPSYPTGKRTALINLPHQRPMSTYLISDVSECSCGGLHGELGEITRVSCLREKMNGNCPKCRKSWAEHECP